MLVVADILLAQILQVVDIQAHVVPGAALKEHCQKKLAEAEEKVAKITLDADGNPKGTEAVEELIWELKGKYTIVIVTHNMAQARRASEECIFMLIGKLVEHAPTDKMFVTPSCQETADYIEGRYG